jgi:hypothetical protein
MFEKNVLQPVARNSHLKNACRSMLTSYLKYKVKTPAIIGVHTERTTDLLQVTDKLYYILLYDFR